jgi:hypothetical protein
MQFQRYHRNRIYRAMYKATRAVLGVVDTAHDGVSTAFNAVETAVRDIGAGVKDATMDSVTDVPLPKIDANFNLAPGFLPPKG